MEHTAVSPLLIALDEPPAFAVVNAEGRSNVVLTCDHASPRIPRALGTLGLTDSERLDHIGWDIGAADVARRLSSLLDAPLVLSGYSRLVIDCNRVPGVPTSIPHVSGGVVIPGNAKVSARDAELRAEACFWPYHRAVSALLDAREAVQRPTVLLSIHSFTPSLLGAARPWNIALLYGRDRRLAGLFIDALRADASLVVGDNEPYHVTDEGDYGIPVYGERRGLAHVLIELRQDGVRAPEGAAAWAERLAAVYRAIEARVTALRLRCSREGLAETYGLQLRHGDRRRSP